MAQTTPGKTLGQPTQVRCTGILEEKLSKVGEEEEEGERPRQYMRKPGHKRSDLATTPHNAVGLFICTSTI